MSRSNRKFNTVAAHRRWKGLCLIGGVCYVVPYEPGLPRRPRLPDFSREFSPKALWMVGLVGIVRYSCYQYRYSVPSAFPAAPALGKAEPVRYEAVHRYEGRRIVKKYPKPSAFHKARRTRCRRS